MSSKLPFVPKNTMSLINSHLSGIKHDPITTLSLSPGLFGNEDVDERFIKQNKVDDESASSDSSSSKSRKNNSGNLFRGVLLKIVYLPGNILKGTISCCSNICNKTKKIPRLLVLIACNAGKTIISIPSYILHTIKSCLLGTYSCIARWFSGGKNAKAKTLKCKEDIELKRKQLWADLGLTKTTRPNFLSGNIQYKNLLSATSSNPAIFLMAIMLKLAKEGYDDLKEKLEEWEKVNTAIKIMADEKYEIANKNAELQEKISENDAFFKTITGLTGAAPAFIPAVGQAVSIGIQTIGRGIHVMANLRLNSAKDQNLANMDLLNSRTSLANSLAQNISQEISHLIQMINTLFVMGQDNLRTDKESKAAITQCIR